VSIKTIRKKKFRISAKVARFEPNIQGLYVSIHMTYPAVLIETTGIVQEIKQFKV